MCIIYQIYLFLFSFMADYKQVKEIKEQVIKTSEKGFKYFLKNAGLIILIFLGCYIFTNPDIIRNPAEFFSNFDRSSIFSFATLFMIVFGIFQLGKSILKENRELQTEETNRKMLDSKKEHTIEAVDRLRRSPEISGILKDVLINLNCTRSSLCEIHNGTNTLAGVPFMHLTMTAEEISDEVVPSADDYMSLNLSRIPFIARHFDDPYWIGSTKDIAKEDRFLASKLTSNNDNYMGFVLIHGRQYPLGILTVAFKDLDDIPSKDKIMKEMLKESQKLSILLDK